MDSPRPGWFPSLFPGRQELCAGNLGSVLQETISSPPRLGRQCTGDGTEALSVWAWSTMEPLCPLLLVGFSLPLARALRGNETTADNNETTTTSGPPDPGASQPLLAWLLLPLLLLLLVLLLTAYFFRFRKQRKAVVSASDKKMPNGILEEQEQQRVMLLSRSPSGPKKYFPIPVEHLEEEIRIRSADDCKQFREEFNDC
uniref:Protein tyrosine phosphatase receptor type E n=1 Tax=Pongo abelii TaxID=9601 RepID=A0A8I5U0Q6_PONAB